jgi:hypothetical protein
VSTNTASHPLGYHGREPCDTTEQVSTSYSLNPARNRAMPARFQVFGTKPPPTSRVMNAPPPPPHKHHTSTSSHQSPPPFRTVCTKLNPSRLLSGFFHKTCRCCLRNRAHHPAPPPSHMHHPTTFTHRLPPLFSMVCPKPSPSGSVLVFFLQYPPLPPTQLNLPFRHHHHHIPTTPPPFPTALHHHF